jgi:hypothetical protein
MLPRLPLNEGFAPLRARFRSQFHANSQSAGWGLISMASHPGAATLLEENEI